MGNRTRAAAGVTAAALLAAFWFPELMRPRLERAAYGACFGCSLGVGSLRWHFAPFGLEARGVEIRAGDPRDSALVARVERLVIPLSPIENLRGPWRIGVVGASGVNVFVHEGDSLFPAAAAGKSAGAGVEIKGVEVRDAEFTYRKDSPAGAAFLRLTNVGATAGEFGTSERLVHEPLEARASATFEGSGAVDLRVAAKYFERPAYADVDLWLRGQRLDGVNEYFQPENGLALKGDLVSGHGVVRIRGARGIGTVGARFEGFGVKFHSNRSRGGLAAFFENLAAAVKLRKGNLGESSADSRSSVVTVRHERESAVSFVLRTLREGALRVAEK